MPATNTDPFVQENPITEIEFRQLLNTRVSTRAIRELAAYLVDYISEEADRGNVLDADVIRNGIDAWGGGAE